jgi:hypothetical protein
MDPCLQQAPTPQKMAMGESALSTLLREGGRRIMAWVLRHMEPAGAAEMPSRLWWQGQASRRRRKPRPPLATRLGPVVVWRRLSAPLEGGARALHPLELRVGREAGWAPPALAKRIGVAYLLAADNVSRLPPSRLREVNQPVIRTLNWFSSLRPRLLASRCTH